MKLSGHPNWNVEVVGFGSPPVLSHNLATSCPYVLTVVNDCDVVPRLSGITLANALLKVRGFNWTSYAQRDINHAIDELGRRRPNIFPKDTVRKLKQSILPLLKDLWDSNSATESQITPRLYVPGRCVHLFHDGRRLSASFVSNDFFAEIDVTRKMIDDHLFHSGYERSFLELLRYHTNDNNFCFEEKTTNAATS